MKFVGEINYLHSRIFFENGVFLGSRLTFHDWFLFSGGLDFLAVRSIHWVGIEDITWYHDAFR